MIDTVVRPGNLQKLLDGSPPLASKDQEPFISPPIPDITGSMSSFAYTGFDSFEVVPNKL